MCESDDEDRPDVLAVICAAIAPLDKKLKDAFLRMQMLTKDHRRQCCVICKKVCFDPEPTGVTCGSLECLAEVGRIFFAASGAFDAVLKASGLSREDYPDPKDLVERVNKALKDLPPTRGTLVAIAELLDLDVNSEHDSKAVAMGILQGLRQQTANAQSQEG